MTTLLVNIGGFALMAAIVWWFWLPGSDKNSTDNQHHH